MIDHYIKKLDGTYKVTLGEIDNKVITLTLEECQELLFVLERIPKEILRIESINYHRKIT